MLEIHAHFALFLFTEKPIKEVKQEEVAFEEVNANL